MVITRELHKIILPKEWEKRISEKRCPVCGKHKEGWKRRKELINCSKECTEIYSKEVIYGWSQLRIKVFFRDNYTCVKCGKKTNDLVADHVIPIALGGRQWDIENIQSLCNTCNKQKTKEDAKTIAKVRAIEKIRAKNKTIISFNVSNRL